MLGASSYETHTHSFNVLNSIITTTQTVDPSNIETKQTRTPLALKSTNCPEVYKEEQLTTFSQETFMELTTEQLQAVEQGDIIYIELNDVLCVVLSRKTYEELDDLDYGHQTAEEVD